MNQYYSENKNSGQQHIKRVVLNNSYELKHADDLDKLVDEIGDAKYVLLGEASHGTHEYYTWRSQLSKKLIEKKGFSFIAVEGDWPDSYKLNRYVKNYAGSGTSAYEVLNSFNRWPTWMWANWETAALAEWLKKHNENLPTNQKTGFYGLDVYSLWESMEAIIRYLSNTDIKAMETAMKAYQCFEPFGNKEGLSYAHATRLTTKSCENEVLNLLKEIHSKISTYNTDSEEVFSTEQNAWVMLNAEKYYRTMLKGGAISWNLRDSHMMDTLDRLMNFHGDNAKCIVWEHNTHIGDASSTDMYEEGMFNLGQLAKEEHGEKNVYAVGFGSYSGTVMAGQIWGDDMHVMNVPPAMKGSWEDILHQADEKDRVIFMSGEMKRKLGFDYIPHRAIGVVYQPENEQEGNYVPSIIPGRYDAFIYLDKTQALYPIHNKQDNNQMPETFPFGF